MGFKLLDLKMPTDYEEGELRKKIAKKLRIKDFDFTYTVDKKSLDARHKHRIHWQIRVGVSSSAIKGEAPSQRSLQILKQTRSQKVIVVGSGPAGFFAAYTLALAGFKVTILEQGSTVPVRFKEIISFERSGLLNERNNYAYGEGGAGTFSDGKLTSRTKSISIERGFIFDTFVKAGAPAEISWMSHPHIGSDNLRRTVKNLRRMFMAAGGEFLFDTRVMDLAVAQQTTKKIAVNVDTDKGRLEADYFVFAVGHSCYDTYRMLIGRGVPFGTKPFAIGCRAEHHQELINRSQWNCSSLPGVKAAEYRLTSKNPDLLPVYTFCMCPGGKVVPASVSQESLIVNGMSNYRRNARFANAAVVAGIHLNRLLEREPDPLEALDWVNGLEEKFFRFSGSYKAPACGIRDFMSGKGPSSVLPATSYPFGLVPADLTSLLPAAVTDSLRKGLEHFSRKIKGYEDGILLGLESKTSSPIQAHREKSGRSVAVDNLYISGEGSGFAGGIVSSAADGIKAALDIISR